MREVQGKGGRGPFKVFNFEVVDKEGSAIRIASFGETAEKVYNQVQKDKTYYISGTSNAIRNANKRFNNTGHDYEISLNSDCVIEECEEQIAKAKFVLKPVPLAKINELNGQSIDVLAVIEKVEDCQTVSLNFYSILYYSFRLCLEIRENLNEEISILLTNLGH